MIVICALCEGQCDVGSRAQLELGELVANESSAGSPLLLCSLPGYVCVCVCVCACVRVRVSSMAMMA